VSRDIVVAFRSGKGERERETGQRDTAANPTAMPFLGFSSPFRKEFRETEDMLVKEERSSSPDTKRSSSPVASSGGVVVKPMQLVSLDEASGKFALEEEALDVIRKTEGQVAVVSVCGRSRQGKSYLLNLLLKYFFDGEDEEEGEGEGDAAAENEKYLSGNGFQTSGSTLPCTKGLYLWPEPLEGTKDGELMSVFFVDSEGIDSYDQTSNYSAEIFSLSVLLSSVFIYNSMGAIDESALDKLSLVCELTRMIKSQSGPKKTERARAQERGREATESNSETSAPSSSGTSCSTACSLTEDEVRQQMPSLIWLLRDFYLDFEDGSPKDYIEKALQSTTAATKVDGGERSLSTSGDQRNAIRRSIKSLFPERECLALVRPHTSEKALRKLDQVRCSDLREEFKQGVKELQGMIVNQVRPKKFGDRTLDGPLLVQMAELYVKAINEGAVPSISSAWESVAEGQCVKAVQNAKALYQHTLAASGVRAEEPVMQKLHEETLEEALEHFDEVAAGSFSMKGKYRSELVSELTGLLKDFKAKRYMEAEIACLHAISKAETEKRDLVGQLDGSSQESFANFYQWVESFVEQYSTNEEGLSKFDLLCNFLLSCVGDLSKWNLSRSNESAQVVEKLRLQHGEDVQKKDVAMATLKEVLKAEQVHLGIQLRREQAINKRLGKKGDALQQQVDVLQRQLEASNTNVEYTSSIVEKWAREAREAAKTPPPNNQKLELACKVDPQDFLCNKLQTTALANTTKLRDVTNTD
jgi:hypothetical protein